MTNPKAKYTPPDWISGDLLDAWNNYFIIRKKRKIVVTDYVKNNRIKQLIEFRKSGMDLVKIIDAAAEANWHKFYPPKDFVRHEEKPVQKRSKAVESDEIRDKRMALKRLYCDHKAINAPLEIDRLVHQERIIKAEKDLDNAIKNARKLGDILEGKK